MPSIQSLIQSNISGLDEGLHLLAILGSEHYSASYKPAFQSTIGAHFRHVLEHYRCLFEQLDSGTISYDVRERDERLECDAEYAVSTITEVIAMLRALQADAFSREYLIKDQQSETPVISSLERELLFLQSHAVHHYAIIAAMTRAFGKQPQADFGVAIATRAHQAAMDIDNSSQESSQCAQ